MQAASTRSFGVHTVGYLTTGKPPPRYGNEHPSLVPYQVFKTADGHVIVAHQFFGLLDQARRTGSPPAEGIVRLVG